MIVLVFLLGGIVALCIGLIRYGRQNYGTLEGNGYPVVPPTLFLGSNPNLHKEVQHDVDVARLRKYGGIWGAYEGIEAQVFVCDPELVRLIYVKEHEHFYDRRELETGSPLLNEVLDFLPGEKWKTVRAALSPAFTTSKLKGMMSVIDGHGQEYVQELRAESGTAGRVSKYDCKKRISTWFIDMFARTTLGVQLTNSTDPDNEFATAFRVMMGENITYGWSYTLSMTFPFLSYFSPTFDDKPAKVIDETLRRILASRRGQPSDGRDAVEILNGIWARVDSPEYKALGITHATVISQAVDFFLGGYDTSSTTSSHLLYHLASNPEIQAKLHAEIVAQFPRSTAALDHENTKEELTPYLTACINEALRMCPPVIRMERVCSKDWTYQGIRIRKGTVVLLPSFAGHRDPKYFPDPDSFRPDRFLAENKGSIPQYAFTPFGLGHRQCIGTRFAYKSIKIFFIHLLRNFRVEKRADTVLAYKKGVTILASFDPLFLDLVPREDQHQ